eukprot:921088-Rhodomonas_salina.5
MQDDIARGSQAAPQAFGSALPQSPCSIAIQSSGREARSEPRSELRSPAATATQERATRIVAAKSSGRTRVWWLRSTIFGARV